MLPLQPSLEPGTEVSRYRIEELVARGGMGLVYRARDVRLDRLVALKVLSPELSEDTRFRERFVRESRLAAAVDHPHVIPVYEADEWNGLLYIAMRFVQGVDLHTVLATSGPMDPGTAVPLLTQAADALDAAHRVGLVHRDVKPGNFMLVGAQPRWVPPGTHVYLTDFGLTKRATSVSGLTRTGQFLGSLHYVAPEQIRGEDVDARTDVYALACVAFELLSGEPPYRRDEDAALLWAHMSVSPPPLTEVRPDLPGTLDDVLAGGMAKDRAERPATCGQFVESVRAALDGSFTGPMWVATAELRGDGGLLGDGGLPGGGVPMTGSRPGAAPSTVQQRRQTPVAPVAAVAAVDGGPPVQDPGDTRGTVATRGRRRWLLPVAVVLVLVLAVLLALWRPWAGTVTRDLVVVPYQADVPEQWRAFTVTGDVPFTVLGSRDWSGFVEGDESAVADAEAAADGDPDSLVYLYVDDSAGVDASTSADAADQLESGLPYPARVVEQGTRQVDGREAFEVGGVLPLGESAELRLYAVVVQEDPRALLVFICPPSVYDTWRPTFEAIVDSVQYTG